MESLLTQALKVTSRLKTSQRHLEQLGNLLEQWLECPIIRRNLGNKHGLMTLQSKTEHLNQL